MGLQGRSRKYFMVNRIVAEGDSWKMGVKNTRTMLIPSSSHSVRKRLLINYLSPHLIWNMFYQIKMKPFIKIEKKYHLPFVLSLISIHSFLVGVGLILFQWELMEYIGFQFVHERFFKVQAGVFHILLSIWYILPVISYNNFKRLVIFSIIIENISNNVPVHIFSFFWFNFVCAALWIWRLYHGSFIIICLS